MDRYTLFACVIATVVMIEEARAEPRTVTCSSSGPRIACPADTSTGVHLARTTSSRPCVEGTTWGVEQAAIWVSEGCAGEFVLGEASPGKPGETGQRLDSWGAIEAGKGYLIGRSEHGELSLSAYALIRYLNQLPAGQTFTDHLGREREVDTRHDIFAHRIMVHLKGWAGVPKLLYQLTLWTVNTTAQMALFGVVGYQFHKKLRLYAGLNGMPGSRTMFGSHPYWLGHDRVMADEFFRPYFAYGSWASGELMPGLWYTGMIANNNSSLDITAAQLTRSFAFGGSLWWMPTTHEFGPNGSFDDWEHHEDVATRFGISAVTSREDPFTSTSSNTPENTTLRLTDSLNLFDAGSLAEGVQVTEARYSLVTADAGFKYRGVFVGAQYMRRWLHKMRATGPLPMSQIVDQGFYVQAAFYPLPKVLQLYGVTSWVFGDTGFPDAHEYIGGANWFFVKNTRDIRLNAQMIWIDRSPVSSSFGYYIGGQKGPTFALAVSMLF